MKENEKCGGGGTEDLCYLLHRSYAADRLYTRLVV